MLIDHFIKRGQKFLGCRYPIMCGAMTWVSDPSLVAAVGNAGAFGLLAGQSVGLVEKVLPLKGIVDEMIEDAEAELQRLKAVF